MATRKKKKKAAKAAKKSTTRKSAVKKAKRKKASKARGKKSARRGAAAPKPPAPAKRTAQRRLALLAVSGRRAKSVPSRGPARGRVTARPRIAKVALAAPRVPGVVIKAALGARHAEVLTPAALRFLADLHREFEAAREQLFAGSQSVRSDTPSEMPEGASVTDIVIVNLADVGFAGWPDRIKAHIGLKDRTSGKDASGLSSALVVQPREWHVAEEGLVVDGRPIAAALFDFGLCVFHNRHPDRSGNSPGFCLPGLEAPGESGLWQNVLAFAQDRLGLPEAIAAKPRIKDFLLEP